ncbi:MAG: hypothetical protein U9Q71_04340, partial [Pseudomonadota bacterium]|nr:hypothetical protein [Pseudomonadota bacterium]
MSRRLYYLFPDVDHARNVVGELQQAGVNKSHVHAIAKPGIDISSLPPATVQQKSDRVWFIDRLFWNGNLAVFGMALFAFLVSLYWGFSIWSGLAVLVMFVTFVAGAQFAVKVPHVHLREVRSALSHGEILLMVDVSGKQVSEVNDLVLH